MKYLLGKSENLFPIVVCPSRFVDVQYSTENEASVFVDEQHSVEMVC